MAANKGLTPKQSAFIEEYLIDLNATAAYKRAGYAARGNAAEASASILLRNPKVAATIAVAMNERSRRTRITADRVLKEIARLAFLDIGKAFTEGGNLKPLHEMDEDTRRAIAGLEVSALYADGEAIGKLSKLKLADKLRALELLSKHVGLFDSKVTVGGNSDTLSLFIQSIQGSSFKPVVIHGDKAA